ncbi:hypothetical protein PR048_013339 [Dryococelus australis]|uniref:Uncharacterized protein n=1 Tax=Dryococelus australis TaxID=614101 RepID=A0ABQ9HSQ2_9NEOP|nr:hypothetical protein PR048_013339 [Dryococelus australis]
MIPYARVNRDFICMLTLVCAYSKYACAIPVRNKSALNIKDNSLLKTVFKNEKTLDKLKLNVHVGDFVRISRVKVAFEKGCVPRWSNEVLKFVRISHYDPRLYYIEDMDSQPIRGGLYSHEIEVKKIRALELSPAEFCCDKLSHPDCSSLQRECGLAQLSFARGVSGLARNTDVPDFCIHTVCAGKEAFFVLDKCVRCATRPQLHRTKPTCPGTLFCQEWPVPFSGGEHVHACAIEMFYYLVLSKGLFWPHWTCTPAPPTRRRRKQHGGSGHTRAPWQAMNERTNYAANKMVDTPVPLTGEEGTKYGVEHIPAPPGGAIEEPNMAADTPKLPGGAATELHRRRGRRM